MRRPAWTWLLVALALLGCATWLMTCGEVNETPPWRHLLAEQVEFPRTMREEEYTRLRERQRPPDGQPKLGDEYSTEPVADPVLRALPALEGNAVVVVEANALRHSPLGELFVACMMSDSDKQQLDQLRQSWGIDPLEDLDRVAVADQIFLLSGHFGEAKWDEIFSDWSGASYGNATIYSRDDDGEPWAVWNDEMILRAKTEDELEAALDRLDGRDVAVSPLSDDQSYGEMYGALSANAVAELLPPDQTEIAETLKNVVDRVDLNVSAMSDVAMVAAFRGSGDASMTDLAKSFGAALSLARMAAAAHDQAELVELLDYARVQSSGAGTFNIELALPQELVEEHLRQVCRQRHLLGADALDRAGESVD